MNDKTRSILSEAKACFELSKDFGERGQLGLRDVFFEKGQELIKPIAEGGLNNV